MRSSACRQQRDRENVLRAAQGVYLIAPHVTMHIHRGAPHGPCEIYNIERETVYTQTSLRAFLRFIITLTAKRVVDLVSHGIHALFF